MSRDFHYLCFFSSVEEAFSMRDEFRTKRQNCKPKLTAEIFLLFFQTKVQSVAREVLTVSLVRLCQCVWNVGCQLQTCRNLRHISPLLYLAHASPHSVPNAVYVKTSWSLPMPCTWTPTRRISKSPTLYAVVGISQIDTFLFRPNLKTIRELL
jgi:hypothetical protein